MRKLALVATFPLALMALLAGATTAAASGTAVGPDRPGPYRPTLAPAPVHRAGVAPSVLAPQTCDGSYHKVASVNGPNGNILTATVAVSANDVWAVGFTNATFNPAGDPFGALTSSQLLAEHWNGSAWTITSPPAPGFTVSFFSGITAVSSTDVWAVGSVSNLNGDATIAEHWNGSTWSVVATPNPGVSRDLSAVSAVDSNNVWAVGQYIASGKNNTLVEHWNGISWGVVPSPNAGTGNNQLLGVSVLNATDVWAGGYYKLFTGALRHSLAEHWNGTSWTVATTATGGGDTEIDGVAALASGVGVGVGYLRTSGSNGGSPAEPYQFGLSTSAPGGNSFVFPPMSNGGDSQFLGVAVNSGRVWAVGWWSNLKAGPAQTFVASADYSSGFLPQLAAGVSDNPGTAGVTDDFFLGVAAVSHSGFWAVGWDNFVSGGETMTQLVCRPQLTVAGPTSVTAFTSFSLTVTAADPGGTTIASYTGTVHFTSTDSQAPLPGDYTFVGGDAGSHVFSVALKTVGSQTITVTDTGVPDTNGSIAMMVHCLGVCQAPAGTPGGRGVPQSPAGSPGPRLPRGGSQQVSEEALGAPPQRSSSVAAPLAVGSASHLRSVPAGPARRSSAAPVVLANRMTATPNAGHQAMSLVAQTDPVARRPDTAPWWLLLLAIPLVAALALFAIVRRPAEEESPS